MSAAARLQKYLDDLRTLPVDVRVGWRRERWRGLWDAIAPRTLYRVFRRGRLVVYAQPVTDAREIPPPVGVAIAQLTEADLPAFAAILTRSELERFRVLLSHGHQGLGAWRDGRPVGYAWVALHVGPEVTQCPLPLPPHAAYLWDLYVMPMERSSGIGSALASARLGVARAHGRREGWRMIERTNRASLATLARSAGTTSVVGEMRFVKLLARLRGEFRPA